MEWKNINVNKTQIVGETEKAYLINMPKKSEYQGYSFWHPAKLVRSGRHVGALSLGYTDKFTFKLKKYGEGKYNKTKVLKEKEITVKEFEKAFGETDEHIVAPKK